MLFAKPPPISSRLPHSWQSRNWLSATLLPLALVYWVLVRLRRFGYQMGWFPSHRVRVPVLVVGNAVVGGAGKTPTVISIVKHLQSRGLKVGVISRGYGRTSEDLHEVCASSSPTQAGDEPLLIYQATKAPTMVGSKRAIAAEALLKSHPEIDFLVSDDGLQHYALYRNLEVCMFDARGVGNGWLLPAGPLREPWPAAPIPATGQSKANRLILNTGSSMDKVDSAEISGFAATRRLADHALRQDGTKVALAQLAAVASNPTPLLALAGIAQPEQFFRMLESKGLPLARTLGLPDHCQFDRSIVAATQGTQVLCTEKDAAKLWPWLPGALAVPLEQDIEPGFWAALDAALVAQ